MVGCLAHCLRFCPSFCTALLNLGIIIDWPICQCSARGCVLRADRQSGVSCIHHQDCFFTCAKAVSPRPRPEGTASQNPAEKTTRVAPSQPPFYRQAALPSACTDGLSIPKQPPKQQLKSVPPRSFAASGRDCFFIINRSTAKP